MEHSVSEQITHVLVKANKPPTAQPDRLSRIAQTHVHEYLLAVLSLWNTNRMQDLEEEQRKRLLSDD